MQKRQPTQTSLRQLRIDRRWTQAELAEKIGRKQSTVAHWENKLAFPDKRSIDELARVFGFSSVEMFGILLNSKTRKEEQEEIEAELARVSA